MNVKKAVLLFVLLHACFAFSKNSIIILYGCSSAGKTSIATELLRVLPGSWQYIPANRFAAAGGNVALWDHVNQAIGSGSNVIVDTHNLQFLVKNASSIHVIVTLLYCSPESLIEHVTARNSKDSAKDHRQLKTVFKEYCAKFKSVKKSQDYIDILNQETLKNKYGFFVAFALKRVIKKFFTTKEQAVAYIAPLIKTYNVFINTGTTSIVDSAQKIKRELMLRLNSELSAQ